MKSETDEPWYICERAEQVTFLWLTELSAQGTDQQHIVVERCDQFMQANFRVSLASHEKGCERKKPGSLFWLANRARNKCPALPRMRCPNAAGQQGTFRPGIP